MNRCIRHFAVLLAFAAAGTLASSANSRTLPSATFVSNEHLHRIDSIQKWAHHFADSLISEIDNGAIAGANEQSMEEFKERMQALKRSMRKPHFNDSLARLQRMLNDPRWTRELNESMEKMGEQLRRSLDSMSRDIEQSAQELEQSTQSLQEELERSTEQMQRGKPIPFREFADTTLHIWKFPDALPKSFNVVPMLPHLTPNGGYDYSDPQHKYFLRIVPPGMKGHRVGRHVWLIEETEAAPETSVPGEEE